MRRVRRTSGGDRRSPDKIRFCYGTASTIRRRIAGRELCVTSEEGVRGLPGMSGKVSAMRESSPRPYPICRTARLPPVLTCEMQFSTCASETDRSVCCVTLATERKQGETTRSLGGRTDTTTPSPHSTQDNTTAGSGHQGGAEQKHGAPANTPAAWATPFQRPPFGRRARSPGARRSSQLPRNRLR